MFSATVKRLEPLGDRLALYKSSYYYYYYKIAFSGPFAPTCDINTRLCCLVCPTAKK